MFTSVLVANRGEIALRVVRTCQELGIRTIVAHSAADRDSAAVRAADESVQVGPGPSKASYLNIPAVVEAARTRGAEAIHPGYGFLSENPEFAEVCEDEGIVFIGPPASVMAQLGDKAIARGIMREAGLPLLPGSRDALDGPGAALALADEIGFPMILKAVAGGGGRGMRVVRDRDDVEDAYAETRAAALAVFGDGRLYGERYLDSARHVEIQVLLDAHGGGVHLGARDCSLQRRHQKLVEESPAPEVDQAALAELGTHTVGALLDAGYVGAGTAEFLYDPARRGYYFMEVNCRLQVEHPVTEMVTGIDLVAEQLRVAAGEPLGYGQADVVTRGAAIECRLNAEDPARDFRPTPGLVTRLVLPGGPFVRVDTHLETGYRIPPFYDSLLAKIVVWAPDRAGAIARMRRALTETVVDGPGLATTAPFLRDALDHPSFRAGTHDTSLIATLPTSPAPTTAPPTAAAAPVTPAPATVGTSIT
ncbi:acetyl-CoA carboxylase, biotin carboxylase subunit [Frankia canadensis]|uniref:biotin carboxylase n=1 Tax=Frankia canadensis TaxID=1836972 RepID=A0A2I2KJ30_9ACTN|nr:acetyl-CoA carboxylase biotin carboxylase subunit [Frankia canadensis]SNQ45679.1 acetyl-CoA carboxylase, biotin carboxylase subunit [Frankia canadensis]SOU52969.1 acetyl-CoA carboxylase, biotin carboxylase subunit [Frankia canadensis]